MALVVLSSCFFSFFSDFREDDYDSQEDPDYQIPTEEEMNLAEQIGNNSQSSLEEILNAVGDTDDTDMDQE